MEVGTTNALSPELAAELGQALGMKANSTWKVSGIPTYVSKGSLHQAFARQAYGWTGWIVRPVKTLSAPKNGKVDWIVEAASNPPKQTFTINSRDVVCIEEHFALASKRASAWFSAPKVESVPKSIWERQVEQKTPVRYNLDDEVQQKTGLDHTQNPLAPAQAENSGKVGEHMNGNRKRGSGAIEVVDPATNEDPTKQLVAFMQNQVHLMQQKAEQAEAKAAEKDETIKGLFVQIQRLTEEVSAMRRQFAVAQVASIDDSDDEIDEERM